MRTGNAHGMVFLLCLRAFVSRLQFCAFRPFLLHVEHEDNFVKSEDEMDSLSKPMRRRRRRRSLSVPSKQELSSSDSEKESSHSSSTESHPDEHQIKLDTDRSFVLYGVGELLHYVS